VGAADLHVELPQRHEVRMHLVKPGTYRVHVLFLDGTHFDENLPTPERLRKGKVTSTEIGLFERLDDLCVRKVGDGYLPRGYNGKWVKRAINRWREHYRRKGGEQPAANKRHTSTATRKAAEIKAAKRIIANHPNWHDRGASWLATQVQKARVSTNKVGTIRKHLRVLFKK
jgi:hypothetical protein